MFDSPSLRMFALVTSLVAVPALVVLSFREWYARSRASLPQWRNSVGLAAVLLLTAAWLWFVVGLADTSVSTLLGSMYIDFTFLAVSCTWLAAALASAWKGRSRLEVLAACILMFVGWHFFGYT